MKKSIGQLSLGLIFALGTAFVLGVGIMWGIGSLLINIQERKAEAKIPFQKLVEINQDELDPAVWGKNFPHQYDSFIKTQDDSQGTPFGGSVLYSKLDKTPALIRLWAGYAFSKDHNEDRGHHYAMIDQKNTQRVKLVSQPGACANCHSAETPQLIKAMGWEAFNRTPFNDLKDKMHLGSSCADCHDPKTMELRITRPAFKNAMELRGVDLAKATRQEMRSYVCAQCHVEYYFAGKDKVLTFPWTNGFSVENIETYYDDIEFKDWTHKETKAPMIKVQHPEFELWNSSLHAKSGVSCSDCHMPYMRKGAVKVSDHWLRSPLTNINRACQTCHKADEDSLRDRVITIQNRTATLLKVTEESLLEAIDSIVDAQKAGVSDEKLNAARKLHRKGSIRWDFISSENSTGFHSPQESARVLANAVNFARKAQISAINAKK